jgi:hypothetical protein
MEGDTTSIEIDVTSDVCFLVGLTTTSVCSIHVTGALTQYDGHTAAVLKAYPRAAAVCMAVTRPVGGESSVALWVGRRDKLGISVLSTSAEGVLQPLQQAPTLDAQNDIVTCLAPVGHDRMVSHGTNRHTVVWLTESLVQIVSVEPTEWMAFSMCVVGNSMWCSTEEGGLRTLDLLTCHETLVDQTAVVTCLLWVPLTETLWTGAEDASLSVYDPWSGALLQRIEGQHHEPITALAVACAHSFQGSRRPSVWSASADGTMIEWDPLRYAPLRTVDITHVSGKYVTSIAIICDRPGREALWFGGTLPCLTATFSRAAAPMSPGRPATDERDVAALLVRIEELETEALRAKEIVQFMNDNIEERRHTTSVTNGHDGAATEDLALQLECYERRIEELEHSLKAATPQRGGSGAPASEADPCDALIPRRSPSADAASQRALKLLEGRYEALLRDVDMLELKVDDYKALAREATVRGDDLEGRLASAAAAVDRHETEVIGLHDQLAVEQRATTRARVATSVAVAERDALAGLVEVLERSVHCLHEDCLRVVAQSSSDAAATQQRMKWSASELAAVEGLLLENESLQLQLRLVEQMLVAQKRRIAPTQQAGPADTLTACFLALRSSLPPPLANAIALEALADEAEDEAHAVELLVQSLARRLNPTYANAPSP